MVQRLRGDCTRRLRCYATTADRANSALRPVAGLDDYRRRPSSLPGHQPELDDTPTHPHASPHPPVGQGDPTDSVTDPLSNVAPNGIGVSASAS